jgi:hypothetical protein
MKSSSFKNFKNMAKSVMVFAVAIAATWSGGRSKAQESTKDKDKESVIKFDLKHENIGRKPAAGDETARHGKWAVKVDVKGLQVSDAKTGEPVFPPLKPPKLSDRPMPITTWKFSPDDTLLAIGIGDGRGGVAREERTGGVSVWDLTTGKMVASRRGGRVGYVYRIRWLDATTIQVECEDESGL